MKATHCEITMAVHDMNGFAPLGVASVDVFDQTPEISISTRDDDAAPHSFLLDLFDGEFSHIDEKEIDAETAAALTGLPIDAIAQIGRQRLAQINDEFADYWASR